MCSVEYVPIPEITNNHQEFYNETKEEIEFQIYGLQQNYSKIIAYHFLGIILLGVPYFLCYVIPKFNAYQYNYCDLENATILLVYDNHHSYLFLKIEIGKIFSSQHASSAVDWTEIRYFHYQHTKYIWDAEQKIFSTVDDVMPNVTVDDYLNNHEGLEQDEYRYRLDLYGFNKIEVEIKSYWALFVEEVVNPFYFFQVFSVILWMIDDYVSYSVCVIILTLFSSITSLIQTRKQSKALHDLVETSKCHEATVLRKNNVLENIPIKIDPDELVPGDLLILPGANYVMPCDAVLLTGQCIINESVLTGESVPITKTAPSSGSEFYNIEKHKRHTLFAGTNVIQTRFYGGEDVLARVVRTGFDTTKGSLVKSILYPSPVGFKFYKDSIKFVLFLFTMATFGMGFSLYCYISRGADLQEIIIRTLDIITIVVPPALPAAMAVGTVYSQNRLKRIGIYCISPARINIAGKIKLACFDKTGTLTHDGLDMNSVLPCDGATFSKPVINIRELDPKSELVKAMATCHSITRIDGQLNGDPLDLNLFKFTGWELEEPGDNENTRFDNLAPTIVKPNRQTPYLTDISNDMADFEDIGIIRQFAFSSTLQCMSVICRELSKPHMVAYTKGAPEKLKTMCLPETIPSDFNEQLSNYTKRGYRVIAVAYKNLSPTFNWKMAQKAKREVIECDLNFLGLLVMQNQLKKETEPIIRMLQQSNTRTVMITGDNLLTAISVAHDCGMVTPYQQILILKMEEDDISRRLVAEKTGVTSGIGEINFDEPYQFAIDGNTFNHLLQYYQDILPHILVRSVIFARFQPDQKAQLVKHFQTLDYIVSMVGDGANDCGALKAAHVGVSISQAEASVAAPFTSKIENISCIIHLMMEGRCALVTSFAIFKYMALYSLIQFFTVLFLYKQHSTMGDYQFLFIDLIITTSLAFTIPRQGPSDDLISKRPLSSLVVMKNIIPLLLQILTFVAFQLLAVYYLYRQHWFIPIPDTTLEPVIVCWENTVLFSLSCYQYVIVAIVYSKGRPYRQMLITNTLFLLSAVVLIVCTTWMLVYPCSGVEKIMDLMVVPHDDHVKILFRSTLVILPAIHFLLACIIEVCVADGNWLKKVLQIVTCKKHPKNKYKRFLKMRDHESYFRFNNSVNS